MEAGLPANPNAPANQRHARTIERELRKYFQSLEQAFPYDKLDEIYFRYVKESAIEQETEDFLDPILRIFQRSLLQKMNGYIATIYLSGSAEMITWGKTKAGIPIAYEGPPIQQAIDYAEKSCAKLVTRMDEETKSRLAKVISDGIKNKRGIDGLARDIRNDFADMTKLRSQTIARTETANALGQSFIDRGKDMGVNGKQWITVGDDKVNQEICAPNEAQGIIPFDQPFQSGHMAPPGHVNCRCAAAPARLPG